MLPQADSRHRVVIVGGGFGGLFAARLLGRHPQQVDVTLVDQKGNHLFQPLLYQVATGMLSPGQIAPPIRHVLRRLKNVRVELAEVTRFNLDERKLEVRIPGRPDSELHYDSLIVAAGAGQSYFGHDDFAFYAPGMKTIDDALELRRRIFGAFELAESASDPVERDAWLRIAIVGAGPTGVELAGQVRELATRSLRGEFRSVTPAAVRVFLLDGGKEPLASFGKELSARAAVTLERLGVELMMQSRVVAVDIEGVEVERHDGSSDRLEAKTVIWAAGVAASPLAAQLAEASGATVDRSGRVEVLPNLNLPGHPEVFAIGDMASVNQLPGVAEVAMQGGLHAANTIVRRLDKKPDRTFRYRDLGSVATIGRFRAVATMKRLHLSGFPGWLVWFFVHLAFLSGFGNRLSTMLRWLHSMIGRARGERVFSTAHSGGDLSLPESVRRRVQPLLYPVIDDPSDDAATPRVGEGNGPTTSPVGSRQGLTPNERRP